MSDAPATGSTVSPTVSCLMVTANRPVLVQRAIDCYRKQTYTKTELVVLDNGAHPIKHVLDTMEVPGPVQYLYVESSPHHSLGHLRNEALEAAQGDFIVPQWDDDDWSHPQRIAHQVRILQQGHDACTLEATLMHVDTPSYAAHPFIGRLPNGVPPTIMHRRNTSIRYPPLPRTEDTAYVNEWQGKRYRVLPQTDAYLYVRYFHGNNLWEKDHFLRRLRNTPKDLLLYAWHRYVRGDVFQHPRFQLTARMKQAFAAYLEISARFDLLQCASSPS